MENIAQRLLSLKDSLPEGVTLVAVSKFHPAETIFEAYSAGQRDFGESYAGELVQKYNALPKDIRWHFIGHLQRNKVRQVLPFISLIHSVDSERLLREIDRCAERVNRCVDVLLELHVAKEETKSGMTVSECTALLETFSKEDYPHVRIRGLMMMASNTDDDALVAREFSMAEEYFREVKEKFFKEDECFNVRSWGMSDDYEIALKHGSNMVRIGTKIFGDRSR